MIRKRRLAETKCSAGMADAQIKCELRVRSIEPPTSCVSVMMSWRCSANPGPRPKMLRGVCGAV